MIDPIAEPLVIGGEGYWLDPNFGKDGFIVVDGEVVVDPDYVAELIVLTIDPIEPEIFIEAILEPEEPEISVCEPVTFDPEDAPEEEAEAEAETPTFSLSGLIG